MIARFRSMNGGPFCVELPGDVVPEDVQRMLDTPRLNWLQLGSVLVNRRNVLYVAFLDELPKGANLVTKPGDVKHRRSHEGPAVRFDDRAREELPATIVAANATGANGLFEQQARDYLGSDEPKEKRGLLGRLFGGSA